MMLKKFYGKMLADRKLFTIFAPEKVKLII